MEKKSTSFMDGLGDFLAGESTLKAEVGINTESMVKLAVVAIVATTVCVFIVKILK